MKKAKVPSNQELRTRKDLLAAASRLMKQGRVPTMDEVAKEALVSRPTAYRYFHSIDALLNEAAVDEAVLISTQALDANTSTDPEERLLAAEAAMHRSCYENEAQLRVMLASSVNRDPSSKDVPARQNRRLPLIEAALAPARSRFKMADYQRLCAALCLVLGTESMIVFRDVLGVDEPTAREVKNWTIRTLVRGALAGTASET
ncbi:MAG TPA: TetR family transcriptional regulator [Verrucomicrobiales bacterium]|nr:TetR family transcriptional regulator [Verrucomicrobiales bacterium]